MSEIQQEWQAALAEGDASLPLAAPQPASRKTLGHEYISDNLAQANLTPQENYQVAWGPDALSEDWIHGKAAEIKKQVEDSASIATLRKGLAKTAATPGAPGASDAAGDKPAGSVAGAGSSAGGGGDSGQGYGDNSTGFGDAANDDGSISSDRSFDGWGGVLGLGGGLLAGGAGALAGKALGSYFDRQANASNRVKDESLSAAVTVSENSKRAAAQALAAERAAAQSNGTGGNFSQSDLDGFNATSDPIGALADAIGMGESGGGDGGYGGPGTGDGNSAGSNGGGGGGGPGNDRD